VAELEKATCLLIRESVPTATLIDEFGIDFDDDVWDDANVISSLLLWSACVEEAAAVGEGRGD
jgi:hypothetical protein